MILLVIVIEERMVIINGNIPCGSGFESPGGSGPSGRTMAWFDNPAHVTPLCDSLVSLCPTLAARGLLFSVTHLRHVIQIWLCCFPSSKFFLFFSCSILFFPVSLAAPLFVESSGGWTSAHRRTRE